MKLTMRATATLGKKVTLISAAFVLAVSTLTAAVPFILNSTNASAVAGYNYTNIGLDQSGWTPDRQAPSGYWFTDSSNGRVVISINQSNSSTDSFRKTEGVSTSVAAGSTTVSGSFTIASDWSSKSNLRVGLWGVTNAPAGWPIIEYAANVDGYTGWRIWDTVNGGWTNVSATTNVNGKNTVEIALNPYANTFTFFINGTSVGTLGANGNQVFERIILNQYNKGTGVSTDNYTVDWRNLRAGSAPVTTACTTSSTVWSNNLNAWNVSSTNTAGHNVVTGDGLRVYTDNNSSAKAAAYLAVNYSLAANGSQTIAQSMDWTGGQQPGLQLVVDFDNSGTPDGILVGETVYGNDWWLSNSAQQFVKDNAPNNGGGYGSSWYGELNEWLTKFPTAQVKAVGYSLGSGVESDGVIKRLSYGCVDYKFDNAAPVAPAHLSPSNNAVQSSNNFLFDWNDVSDAVRYEIQNSQSATIDPATGSFQNVQWTGDYLNVQPTVSQAQSVGANGTWYWQVRAIDAAGNASAWTAPWKVTIDAQAPTAPQLNTPTNNQVFTSNSIPASWTAATDANGISKYEVEYIYDDGHTFAGGPYREVSGVTTSRTHAPGTDEQGGVTIRVRAYDTAGNVGAWSNAVHYYYDNTKPTVAVDSATVSSATKTLDVSVTANDAASGVKRIEFNLYDAANTTKIATLKGQDYSDYANTKTLTLAGFDISGLASGTYVIRAAALDNAGLLSAFATQTIVLDNTAPKVVSISYEPGTLTNGNVLATITFDEAVTSITDGWTATDSTNTVFTKTYTANTTGDVVDFEDAAGNAGQANVVINWIDKTAPVISSPITNGATVRGTAVFSVNDSSATVRVNGIVTTSRQVTGDGTYTVVATDAAGNVSNTFSFTINNAQTVTLNPIDLQNPTPLISGTARWVVDPASVGSVEVTIDGTPYAASIDAEGNWSVQVIAPLENGSHTMLVNGQSFSFITSVPASLLTPAITNPAAALGVSDEAASNTDGAGVEGASSENKAAQAVDTDSTDGTVLGLAWYWWLLILAGIALVLWWIIAALRRRQSQDA